MILHSTVEVLGPFPSFPQAVIRAEASQARVGIAEAAGGGPIHRAFIERLPQAWKDDPTVEIFSRALWLKEGWHPLTPHFHFDWGREPGGATVETMMVCLGDASLTEFILGPLEHPGQRSPPGARNRWDEQVQAGLRAGTLRSWHLEPEQLIRFDNRALHRARPATRAGWRLLVRAIRGLGGHDERNQDGYGNPGAFTTCRNGFVPVTDLERQRYQAYQD
jgi:hypothetical protein